MDKWEINTFNIPFDLREDGCNLGENQFFPLAFMKIRAIAKAVDSVEGAL